MNNFCQEFPLDPSLISLQPQAYFQTSRLNLNNMNMNVHTGNGTNTENTTTTISSSSSQTGNQSNDEPHDQLHQQQQQQQQHYHPLHGNVMAVPMHFPQHIFPVVQHQHQQQQQQPNVHTHEDREDSTVGPYDAAVAVGNNLSLSNMQPHFQDMAALGAAAALPYNYLPAGAAAANPTNGHGLNGHHLHQHGPGPGHMHDPTQIVDPSSINGGHGHNHSHTHTHTHTHAAGHGDDNHDNMDLLNLVLAYDWPAALARISSHPSEATSVGVQGRTPLHVACDQDAPAVVIQALLKANPMASTMVGTSDMNPLHITCSCQHASVEVVRVLLDSHNLRTDDDDAAAGSVVDDGIGNGDGIQNSNTNSNSRGGKNIHNQNYNNSGHDRIVKVTSMKDVDGDTPLHAACRCGAPIDVLEELLKANPAAVHDRDYEGLTPLLRLWVRYFVTLGDDVINGVENREDVKGELAEAWRKTEVLLKASYHGSIRTGMELESKGGTKLFDHKNNNQRRDDTQSSRKRKRFHTLHAASAVDCPRAVVKIATILYPDQLEKFDTTHRTPLMIASLAPIFKEHDLSGEGYYLDEIIHGDEENDEEHDNDHANDSDSNANASNRIGNDEHPSPSTEQKQPTVLQILLEAGADARRGHRQLNRKRIPLHHALAKGKRWHEGIKLLRNAYPDGLIKVDKQTGLYAFMLAAANDNGQNSDVGKKVVADMSNDLNTVFNLLRSRPEALLLRDDKPNKSID